MRKNYNSLKSSLNSKHELIILASATKLNPLLRASKNVFTWASFLGLRLPVGGLICLVDWLDTGCCISHLFFIHVDILVVFVFFLLFICLLRKVVRNLSFHMILAEDSHLVLNVTFEGVCAGTWLLILLPCCRRLLREGSQIKLGDQL